VNNDDNINKNDTKSTFWSNFLAFCEILLLIV
jgi:hypothetical protein